MTNVHKEIDWSQGVECQRDDFVSQITYNTDAEVKSSSHPTQQKTQNTERSNSVMKKQTIFIIFSDIVQVHIKLYALL